MDAKTLQACMGCTPEKAAIWADPMSCGMETFQIDSPARQAMFLAQVAHESALLEHLIEGLTYTSAKRIVDVWPTRFTLETAELMVRNPEGLANKVYADRNGNGNEDSGDGYRFRGRGPIQLTGRDNYHSCGQAIDVDLVKNPDLLITSMYGALSAGWFWWSRNLNHFADQGDILRATRAINGGKVGLEERTAIWIAAKKVLGVS